MKSGICTVVAGLAVFVPALICGQDVPPSNPVDNSTSTSRPAIPFRGFNSYASLSGLATGSGSLLKLDSSVGYDLNRNFGIYAGVPFYFNSSFGEGPGGGTIRAVGMGDAYVGAEYYASPKYLKYSTGMTIGFPTGNMAKGFSPGTVTFDWTNRVRRHFGRFTPTVIAGVGNTVGVAVGSLPSSSLIDGSLATRGTFVHLEEGANFDLTRRFYIGGEGYQLLPLTHGSLAKGDQGATNAVSSIAADNGVNAWIGFRRDRLLSTEIGYSRSLTFGWNSVSFRVGLNVGRMLTRPVSSK